MAKSDTLNQDGDLGNKVNGSHEIYPEITTLAKYGREYYIDINGGKIKIRYKETHRIYEMEKQLPGI